MTPDFVAIEATTPEGIRHSMTAPPKTFKSGRSGYFATSKLDINGAKHQVSMIFTKIIPKEKPTEPTTQTPKSNEEGS